MLEDISLMRALPNMSVVVPADAPETAQVIRWAADYKGPVYIRLGRAKVEDIPELDKEFKPGISTTLCEGKDITLIACGIMTIKAIKAAEILKEEGIFARVINMSSIKPIDSKAIEKAAKEKAKAKAKAAKEKAKAEAKASKERTKANAKTVNEKQKVDNDIASIVPAVQVVKK